MSHTFTGPQGTTFIYNSDLSGTVEVVGVANFRGNAEITGVDLTAFHAHTLREHAETMGTVTLMARDWNRMQEQIRELERNQRVLVKGATPIAAPDRERIEFIRRAAIAEWTHPEYQGSAADVWIDAKRLWEAKPDGC